MSISVRACSGVILVLVPTVSLENAILAFAVREGRVRGPLQSAGRRCECKQDMQDSVCRRAPADRVNIVREAMRGN